MRKRKICEVLIEGSVLIRVNLCLEMLVFVRRVCDITEDIDLMIGLIAKRKLYLVNYIPFLNKC